MTNSTYTPPKVWTWDAENGGRFSKINRPIAGATHDKALPIGEHPLQLHSLGTPNGVKVTIMLEELLALGKDAEYDAFLINITEGSQFSSGFVAINPNSKIPALLDTETGIRVFESGSILLYLAEKFDAFVPKDLKGRTECHSWLMWQMGGVGPMAGQAHHFLRYAPAMDPPQILPYAQNRYRAETKRLYTLLDKQLSVSEFVAGDFFSIADMAIWSWASLWRRQEQTLDDKPNFSRWLEIVKQRPGVQAGRALEAARRTTQLEEDREAQKLLFRQT